MNAVEGVVTPEEVLRQQLQATGMEGENYDFIHFEGEARSLPRKVRSMLAHLHVTLGHLSNERLARMLSLAGGGRNILLGAKHLRCQVCCMVRPPQSRPQVSYNKPSNFNEKVAGDCFHVWDVKGLRYTALHFIDELTDYQVGDLTFDPNSGWASRVLRDKWYGVFGPPDTLLSDGGLEFQGALARLNEMCGVVHDIVPDQAKWRLGHCERHGAILKIILMKTITALRIETLEEMQWAMVYAISAKNRLVSHGGVSPLQAVTGRNSSLPTSLLHQLTSGQVKFRMNEELGRNEALRRSERIRAAAIEACHWIDAHDGLRRALASRSRAPHLECLREGTTVYVYDPPASRKGLARRILDNVSWSGPGVVVCVERDQQVPKRIWVRIRSKVKAYPLEKIRLATADEMLSAEYITGALKDVMKELEGGQLQVVEEQQREEMQAPLPALPEEEAVGSLQQEGSRHQPDLEQHAEPADPSNNLEDALDREVDREEQERQERRRELRHDVPAALRNTILKRQEAQAHQQDPHLLPFQKKQKLFEGSETRSAAAASSGSRMAEADRRSSMEDAKKRLKRLQQDYRKARKENKEVAREQSRVGPYYVGCAVSSMDGGGPRQDWVAESEQLMEALEIHDKEWADSPIDSEPVKGLVTMSEGETERDLRDACEAEVVTGKLRVEYQWNKLSSDWQAAYREPLKKAIGVYFQHEAIAGVKADIIIDPKKILSSRFVLTNKGGETLDSAVLKARWILGGHRDPEVGKYPTLAPTASLLGHNLLNVIAVQMGWVVHYEDVAAAFLQGKPLPAEREVYVRLPHGYPSYINDFIKEMIGEGHYRTDVLKLLKGGFGLAESPRLWYLEYRGTLEELGLHEMKLVPGMFRAFHQDGRLRAVVCIHVDDTRYAGDETAAELWQALHQRLKFGDLRRSTEGWQKFCGRWERQDPITFEFTYCMDEYVKKIPGFSKKLLEFNGKILPEDLKKEIGSLLGQVSWVARQGRHDLMYGVSNCQQLLGLGDGGAVDQLRKVVLRARKSVSWKVRRLGCSLDDAMVISASDAAYAAQPRGASQGGVTCLLANPEVLQGNAPVIILEASSVKINRVVRCSMSAELSMAATAFEHGDFVRAVMAELLKASFRLQSWKWHASAWKHYLIIDAKTGYDVLSSEGMTADRKVMVDAAVLREAMLEQSAENYVKWVPGNEMISDGLTKWNDNGVLVAVMQQGQWALVDTPEARDLREQAAKRKRICTERHRQQVQLQWGQV